MTAEQPTALNVLLVGDDGSLAKQLDGLDHRGRSPLRMPGIVRPRVTRATADIPADETADVFVSFRKRNAKMDGILSHRKMTCGFIVF